MANVISRRGLVLVALVTSLAAATAPAADVVTEWDAKTCDIVAAAGLGPVVETRVLAIVSTAVYEATNAITGRYPASRLGLEAARGASVEAAVAAASYTALSKLVPSQLTSTERAYQQALAAMRDDAARTEGLAVGRRAAEAVIAMRAGDVVRAEETYRPFTAPGVYVPTVIPFACQWPERKPWLMESAAQMRPGPPPELTSQVWARDFREIKLLGGKNSQARSMTQTEIARFWESTSPNLYHGIVRSVTGLPGRDVTENARLLAAVGQAADDALIAVFDAKYHYSFWRPVTAIRNGDIDGNDETERDPAWTPLINTPMHPEYPCAHCVLAASVGTVLRAEAGDDLRLATASPTAGGATRSWRSVDDFVREVSSARIWDGVHYRNSTEVGTAMGRQIGSLAAARLLQAGPTVSGGGGY